MCTKLLFLFAHYLRTVRQQRNSATPRQQQQQQHLLNTINLNSMSQQPGPDAAAKRSKKRKLKQQSRPLLEQLPAVAGEPAGKQQQQQQQPDALSVGNSKFARALGSTDFQTREQGLQALSRFLTHKQLMSELDMLKLWKGIYFCFWHSDKEAVQEDLAERLAGLIPRMHPPMAVLYWSAMLCTLRAEWFALDRHRLNKFLMLVRKFLGAVFARLAAAQWDLSTIQAFTTDLPLVQAVIPSSQSRSLGLSYHLADIWLPELRKAAGSQPLPQQALEALLEPLLLVLQQSGEAAMVGRIRESVFDVLVQDLKAAAAGAATAAAESGSDTDDEEADANSWAYCQQLDVQQYAALLFDRGAQEGVKARNREALYSISKDLERLAGKRRKLAAAAAAAPAAGDTQPQVQAEKKQKKRQQKEQQQEHQQQQQVESVANGHAQAAPHSSKKHKKHAQQQQQEQQEQQAEQQQQQQEVAGAAVTPSSSQPGKKHKQRADSSKQQTPAAAAAAAGAATAAAANGSSTVKRGVKINLNKNLYHEHGAPPPAADVRTPPRSQPKGSALKSKAVLLDTLGRPAAAAAAPLTAPAGAQAKQQQRRTVVTPRSIPRVKASEFF